MNVESSLTITCSWNISLYVIKMFIQTRGSVRVLTNFVIGQGSLQIKVRFWYSGVKLKKISGVGLQSMLY